MTTKLGQSLAQELEKAQPADELEVVFELHPPVVPTADPQKSRGEDCDHEGCVRPLSRES